MPGTSAEPIVVGVDGSQESDRALDWAAAEAALRERPLRIVHATESWPYRAPLPAPPQIAERLAQAGEALLAKARDRVRERWPELQVSVSLIAEETPKVLREQARGAFELVVGSRGRGGFAGMLLGSTGLRMAGRSPVPVVVVRGDTADSGEIVVGIDPLHEPGTVLEYAFQAAALRGARLRVVHAWEVFSTFLAASYAVDERQLEGDLREQIVAAYAPVKERYPQVDVVDEIILEHPVVALANASRNARMVVVGAHDRPWNLPRLGSVSHGVLHQARCPVAVVPPADEKDEKDEDAR